MGEGIAQGGVGAVIFPVPTRVQGENGEPNLLISVDDLEIGDVRLDCIISEDDGSRNFEGESTRRREEEAEEDRGENGDSALPSSVKH